MRRKFWELGGGISTEYYELWPMRKSKCWKTWNKWIYQKGSCKRIFKISHHAHWSQKVTRLLFIAKEGVITSSKQSCYIKSTFCVWQFQVVGWDLYFGYYIHHLASSKRKRNIPNIMRTVVSNNAWTNHNQLSFLTAQSPYTIKQNRGPSSEGWTDV